MSLILSDKELATAGIGLGPDQPGMPDYLIPLEGDNYLPVFLEPDHSRETDPIETIVVCLTESFEKLLPDGGFRSNDITAFDRGYLRLRYMYETARRMATTLKVSRGIETSCEIYQPEGYGMTEAHVRIKIAPASFHDVCLLVKSCEMAHCYLHNPAPELLEHLLMEQFALHLKPLESQLAALTQTAAV